MNVGKLQDTLYSLIIYYLSGWKGPRVKPFSRPITVMRI